MPRFLAIYTGSEEAMRRSGWPALDEAARGKRQAEGFQAWMDWGEANAAAIVDQGSPLGKPSAPTPKASPTSATPSPATSSSRRPRTRPRQSSSRTTPTSPSSPATRSRSWNACRSRER